MMNKSLSNAVRSKCSICDSSFTRKHHLKTRIQSIHEKEKHNNCNTCDATFSQKFHLNKHFASDYEEK